jgi:hypothetical protein
MGHLRRRGAIQSGGGTQCAGMGQRDAKIGPNWLSNTLGELELQELHNRLELCLRDGEHAWHALDDCEHPQYGGGVNQFTPPNFICPSSRRIDPNETINTYCLENDGASKGSYVACWGSGNYYSGHTPNLENDDAETRGMFRLEFLPEAYYFREITAPNPLHDNRVTLDMRWLFGHGHGTKVADVTDGLTNTLMLSEVLSFPSVKDGRGVWASGAMGASVFSTQLGPNSRTLDREPMCDQRVMDLPAPKGCQFERSSPDMWAAARSRHTKGVNAAMADASARFISNDIAIDVWRALSTISVGENVGEF